MTAKRKRRPTGRTARAEERVPTTANGAPKAIPASAGRLVAAAQGDPSDPVQAVAIPALVMDVVTEQHGVPTQRGVHDCVILAAAYGQLGIRAEIRAAVLTLIDDGAGLGVTYGSLIPEWKDGMVRAHSVVWLPDAGMVVDPIADQFGEVYEAGGGAVIAPASVSAATGRVTARSSIGSLTLKYMLAPPSSTPVLLDHPVVRVETAGNRLRGQDIASSALGIMALNIPVEQTKVIPYPRVAALVDALRSLERLDAPNGDIRFVRQQASAAVQPMRLDEIPLPDGTPPPLSNELG